MIKTIVRAALLSFAIANSTLASGNDTATITIIASGETHAMLYPCDCPGDPGGGLAERAAAIKKAGNPAALLLLDAGGFAGGGIYDDYTGGRAADSQRTAATIRVMGMMRYDAAAIGDDDLQYGGTWLAKTAAASDLPLVAANCFLTSRKSIAPSYRIIVKNGIRCAVTALTAAERLFPRDDSCTVLPQVSSVRKIWKEMVAASDLRVILSHLGEEMTTALADSFPECDIIVNGHRKTSPLPVTVRGKTIIMQFGYEGKKLSCAVLRYSRKGHFVRVEKSGWLSVGPAGGADSAVAKVLAATNKAEKRAVYDLYLMSQCSYGCSALREFIDFVKKFPGIEWNVWFIGSMVPGPGDSLSSLHGSEELNDEMAWLAVKALYPDRWLVFLAERGKQGATTGSVVSMMRLDSASIAAWVRASGRTTIAGHYRRAMRLAISASPTLFVNNAAFEKAIESRRLVKEQCVRGRDTLPGAALCDSLPECFDDGECRKKGMIGRCLSSGKCVFFPDAPFAFTALIADSTIRHPESTVIATTGELFPNAAIEAATLTSAKGRTMMKKYGPSSLPFYLFGDGIAGAHNYPRVESGLKKISGGYTFKDGITTKNYFPHRQKTAGAAMLFIDPLFPGAGQAIRTIFADTLLSEEVRLLPVIYADPRTTAATIDEKIRREEALRWLVMDTLYRGNYARYLSHFIEDPGSSYWFINLSGSGIAQDIFITQIKSQAARLSDHWRLVDTLGIKDPITLLIENRQTVVIQNETELSEVFAFIKPAMGK